MKKYNDDSALLAAFATGDGNAFEAIFKTYAAEMYNLAHRNISVKEDCEEIVQDIFEALWVRREKLLITSLRFYLLGAVRHKIMKYFEKAAVRKKYEEHYRSFEVAYESIPVPERDPESIRAKIEQAISVLPPSCRTAMKLRLSENLSNQEIAERMQITKKTVESYLFQAFAHLRATARKQILDA